MTEETGHRLRELMPLFILGAVLACVAVGIGLGYRMAQGLAETQTSEPVRIMWDSPLSSPVSTSANSLPRATSEVQSSESDDPPSSLKPSHQDLRPLPVASPVPEVNETHAQETYPWAFGVSDSEQHEVGKAKVTVWDEQTGEFLWQGITEPNGVVHWPQAPNEPFWVEAEKSGYMRSRTWVGPQDDAAGIVLFRPLQVAGHVRDADSNEPIREFTVTQGQLRYDDPIDWNKAEAQGVQSSLGRLDVQFTQAASGLALLIEAPGFEPLESRIIEPDEGRIAMEFRLRRARGLTGRVLDAQERPVEGAIILPYCRDEPPLVIHNGAIQGDGLRMNTQRGGRFRLPALHEPQTLVVLHESGIALISMPRFLEQGQVVILRPWARVSGQVTRCNRYVPNASIALEYPELEITRPGVIITHQTLTDRHGRFVFDKVLPRGIRVLGREYFLRPGQHLVIGSEQRPTGHETSSR